jgi:hypothetical protein
MNATSEARAIDDGRAQPGDRVAMVLMILASTGAVFAFGGAVLTVVDADSATAVVEAWRMLGFLVFAGLFLLLALRPRNYPGLWELAILHKGGMTIISAILSRDGATDAGSVAVFDGILVLMIIAAYMLSQGYRSWQRW